MPKYDLRTEPWIPVEDQNGQVQLVGLQQALTDAHQWRGIRDPVPIIQFGIQRLLVALVYSIFKPKTLGHMQKLLQAGRLDEELIAGYLNNPGREGAFDLFDDTRPFLQTTNMEDQELKPIAGMLPFVPSGTNVNHFHHHQEADFGVSPAVAARMLTSIAPFMTAGGAGLSPSINGAPPWYVWMDGRSWDPGSPSLLHELLLNQPVGMQHEGSDAPPAWDRGQPVTKEKRTETSVLEALTWQPRRVRLLPSEGGRCAVTGNNEPVLVREMLFAAGWGTEPDLYWTDPNVAYYEDTKGKRLPMRPREGQAIWRDTAHIFLRLTTERQSEKPKARQRFYLRPIIVENYRELARHFPELQTLYTTVCGMRTDLKMKVFEWQQEQLYLPTVLLEQDDEELDRDKLGPLLLGDVVQQVADATADLAYYLRTSLLRTLSGVVQERHGEDASKKRYTLVDHHSFAARAERSFWHAMQPTFDRFLGHLADGLDDADTREKAKAVYAKKALTELRRMFDTSAVSYDRTGNALGAQAIARDKLIGLAYHTLRRHNLLSDTKEREVS